MVPLLLIATARDEFRTRRVPNRRVLAGLAEPWRIFLSYEPARLMLEPVQRSRQDCSTFIPDNLLVVQEPKLEQSVQHLASELRSMPNIRSLEAGNQRECLRPSGTSIARAWLGRTVAVQAGAIAPLRVEFDSIRRICDHQPRLTLADQPRDYSRAGCVAA